MAGMHSANRHGLSALAALLLASQPVWAVDTLVFQAREMRAAGIVAHDVRVQLSPAAQLAPVVRTSIARVELGDALGTLSNIRLACPAAQLDDPRFGCAAANLDAHGSPIGELAMRGNLQWRSDTGSVSANLTNQKFAGGLLSASASSGSKGWTVSARSEKASIAGLRSLVARWFKLPTSITSSGKLAMTLDASGVEVLDQAQITAQIDGLSFGNDDATIAGEDISGQLQVKLQRSPLGYLVSSSMHSATGQALAEGVLLDMKANALDFNASGSWRDNALSLPDINLTQKNIARIRGSALLQPGGPVYVRNADFMVEDLRFPAAYSTFLQNALAAGDFAALTTSGHAQGTVRLKDDAVASVDISLNDVDVREEKGKFSVQNLSGALHWLPADAPAPPVSTLQWRSGTAYGLSGAAAKFEFLLRGRGFALQHAARLPVFDGALRIDTLSARELSTAQVTLQFSGEIEPISMPELSRAFGWPELEGQLSGRIPRVDYRDKLLSFAGDVEARVFNGRITGSNLRLKDPLGPWPRLFADVRARDLDMGLVTRTFSIGSITGKLEADILGLELFNWSPVAFDAALRTPAGDHGQHRISAKAVGNLSNIGGGGGGVGRALQSGAFKMFDEYDYRRIGIRCKLANEVCLMSGVESAGAGYFILQGKGLPHIDIVGNAGRVNWPQLVSQISSQMRGDGKIIVK